MPGPVYQFGDFRLDCGRFELTRGGRSLSVERKPLELLILLAERRGQLVTRTEIAERLWQREVFVDTEHGINTAIRKIRQTLRDDSDEPHFVQTVMGKGYRFVAPVDVRGGEDLAAIRSEKDAVLPRDPPPAAAPAPIVPEAVPPRTAGNRVPSRWLAWAIPALLLAAVAAGLTWHFGIHRQGGAEAGIRSLAILPLDNLSGDPSQDYFADGMTDELTTMLAKDSTLRIVSRTSAMQYKGAHRPLREIAEALGVDGIVEGSVERSGNRVHMTLQLIRADTDAHLWAESYERDADDAALPDEAAQAIAKMLHRSAPATAATRYVNPAAHDAYLRGRYLWFTDRMEESGAYFRKATEIQPDYAAAWAGLADYYGEGIAGDILDPRTSMAPQEQAAERALQLDPNLAQAHQAIGAAFFIDRWDWSSADREILRAIRLDPNDGELYYLRANLLQAMGRFPESIEFAKKAMEIDPFARPYGLASIYVSARQYDAALADLRLRMEASPNNPDLLYTAMDTWRRKGNYQEAVELWVKWHILTGDPQSAVNLRRAYDQGGAHGFIRWQLNRRLMQSKSHYVSPVELACYHAQLGEKEQALALLEEGYRQHSTDILWIQTEPAYDFLHSDPRYRALVQKTGVPPMY